MKNPTRAAVAAAASLALFALSPAAALAGERGGNGAPTPIGDVAASECAYSGLEDFDFEAPVQPGVVQNWGSIPKEFRDFLVSIGVSPATLCNGHLNPVN